MNMAAILWKFKLFDVALIWLQIRNLRPRISGIGLFWTLFIHFWHLFITCQNFKEIWQVCSFNGLSVCLSVCLFVCLFVCHAIQFAVFDQLTRNLVHIWSNTSAYTFYKSNNIQSPAAKSCLVQRASWRKKNRAWRAPPPIEKYYFL